MAPLFLKSGNNAPVDINVKLPLTMEKDKITLTNAQLESPQSKIVISGELDNLAAPTPHSSAHISASISLDEARRVAGLNIPLDLRAGPQFLTADITAAADDQNINIQSARVNLGASSLEAKGTLKEQNNTGNVQFNATLALNEIGRLLKSPPVPKASSRSAATPPSAKTTITSSPRTSTVAISDSTRAQPTSPASRSIPPSPPTRIASSSPASVSPPWAAASPAMPRFRRCSSSTSPATCTISTSTTSLARSCRSRSAMTA